MSKSLHSTKTASNDVDSSSALQVLPAIQPKVKNIVNFVRSPIWILPTISSGAKNFTKDEILGFGTHKDRHTALRKYNESVMNSIFCTSKRFEWTRMALTYERTSIIHERYEIASRAEKHFGTHYESCSTE